MFTLVKDEKIQNRFHIHNSITKCLLTIDGSVYESLQIPDLYTIDALDFIINPNNSDDALMITGNYAGDPVYSNHDFIDIINGNLWIKINDIVMEYNIRKQWGEIRTAEGYVITILKYGQFDQFFNEFLDHVIASHDKSKLSGQK